MKLASLRAGRDGRLVVVSRDLGRAIDATAIADTLQAALDEHASVFPKLHELAIRLEQSEVESFAFDPAQCAAPLPRAYQWIDGSAYVNHVELMRKSRDEPLPPSFWTVPLLYQGGSDAMQGPQDPIPFGGKDWGTDFEAEVAIATDDVPMGISPAAAAEHIVLYMLANDVSLRRLIPSELATGFGFFAGKPATAFAPVAVTPDELEAQRTDGKLGLAVSVRVNGREFGCARADVDQVFTFADLISHASRTRALGAGTIVGGGTVSNKLAGGPGLPVANGGVGYSCIAEQRAVETILHGMAHTPWLESGDRVEIEVLLRSGESVFGRIDQTVIDYVAPGVA